MIRLAARKHKSLIGSKYKLDVPSERCDVDLNAYLFYKSNGESTLCKARTLLR